MRVRRTDSYTNLVEQQQFDWRALDVAEGLNDEMEPVEVPTPLPPTSEMVPVPESEDEAESSSDKTESSVDEGAR